MRTVGQTFAVAVALTVTACATAEDSARPTVDAAAPTTDRPSDEPDTGPTMALFPVEIFTAIRTTPMSSSSAADLQAALDEFARSEHFGDAGGMTATVMTADGTWSGAVGMANDVRDLEVHDQFGIASITKSLVAAQVMSMVEAGELGLDDLAADHLPPDLQFDTNGATIRDLLSHRSGIPDDYPVLETTLRADPLRVWTPAEVLERMPTRRAAAGGSFEYSGANYLLLGLVIEQLRGRPVSEVMRAGVLAVDGTERLVFQPDEKPTDPMASPGGASAAFLETRGGYLPSLSSVSAFPLAGGMASDAPSLARWWQAFCAGEIVSPTTLTEMSAFDPDVSTFDGAYGLGLFNPAYGHAQAVGHQGEMFGYMSWAACLPDDGAVIVVLSSRAVRSLTVELFFGALRPFIDVLRHGPAD